MPKKRHKQNCNFEEDYFEDYFTRIGDFTAASNKELNNWFLAMFQYIHKFVDLQNGKGKRALEYGCAVGAAANIGAQYGYKVDSTDISKYAVQKSKKIYPNINFFVQDIQKPVKTKYKYDFIWSFDVIEHLENPLKAIENMYKAVSDTGIVVCSTPNDYKHVYVDPTHISVKKPEVWVKLFKKGGFKNVEAHQVTFVPFLYRFHWRLNYAFPFATNLKNVISPVFIIAKKK